MLGKRAYLAVGDQLAQAIQRKHDIRILGALGCIEVSRNKPDFSRIGVGWNQAVSQIVVGERLHALDVRTRCTDEGDAAVFQVALQRCIRNATARQFQHYPWIFFSSSNRTEFFGWSPIGWISMYRFFH